MFRKNKSDVDRQHLHAYDDLNKLTEWSEKW